MTNKLMQEYSKMYTATMKKKPDVYLTPPEFEDLLGGSTTLEIQPVAQRWIPKTNGFRKISIIEPKNHLIQRAIAKTLSHDLDPRFTPSCLGFRPRKSVLQGVRMIDDFVQAKGGFIGQIDISNFFDDVHNFHVFGKLGHMLKDDSLHALIVQLCTPPSIDGGRKVLKSRGLYQGAPLSPFLSNVYLEDLDLEMSKHTNSYIRFCDDIVFWAPTFIDALYLYLMCVGHIKNLGLEINESKSGIGKPEDAKAFFGYQYNKLRQLTVACGKVDRFNCKVRTLINEWNIHMDTTLFLKRMNDLVRGWRGHYKYVTDDDLLLQLDLTIAKHIFLGVRSRRSSVIDKQYAIQWFTKNRASAKYLVHLMEFSNRKVHTISSEFILRLFSDSIYRFYPSG